ncbi:tRNA (5-methylaminomethyl-2-thiouridine)(34)-methyltransferase MnmD [Shewanella sp.]|uniref:tRNA (5-methylaminomethyl-2-thiouridine)(34)-methyltransferase MnmD n=1 Tax=Shewanella sp. TaxID=50422 RepID=UPI0035628CCF
MSVKIAVTADGSHTLVNSELDESYHVFKGALTESVYVYIDAGLKALLAHIPQGSHIRVLEVGFGTGLNVLLTAQMAKAAGIKVSLTTLEPFPIGNEIVEQLNYAECLARLENFGCQDELEACLKALHQAPWNATTDVAGLQLTKIRSKLELQNFASGSFDLVYFDAFAPKKQPELWADDNFRRLYQALAIQGLLVSYCANGQFKRDLKAAGFAVESYPGPMGRRHMTRAWKGLSFK